MERDPLARKSIKDSIQQAVTPTSVRSLSHTAVQVTGPECGWLTALALGLLGVRTCQQPRPSGLALIIQ